ncbi:MAG TPA: cysteine hydrolase family protein [Candidatus Obscuribacterales bacterium]
MQSIPHNAVLLLIDVQKGFDHPNHWGKRNNPPAEHNMKRLLILWRNTGRPVIHVRHMSKEADSPLRPGQPGNEFKDEFLPFQGEYVVLKTVNSAFIGTDLEAYLREHKYDTVIIAGISTDHCVSTTTRMSANLGFNTLVVADACHTFNRSTYDGKELDADAVHAAALASLHGEFATVLDSREVIKLVQKQTV